MLILPNHLSTKAPYLITIFIVCPPRRITYNRGGCPNSTIGGVGVYITTHDTNDIVFVNDGSISNNSCFGTRAFGGGVYIINKEGHGKVSFTNSGKISYNSLNAEGTKTSHGAGVDLMGFATDVSAVTMINEGCTLDNHQYSQWRYY